MIPILSGNVASALPSGYDVDNSCRFNDGDSAYMTRANAGSDGNTDTWTMSMWVKRSTLGTNQFLFIGYTSGNLQVSLRFNTSDQLYFFQEDHPAHNGRLLMTTARVFRDTSAWYHIVVQYDSTQSTNTNRAKIYINGVQETTFDGSVTWPDQNFDSEMTSASTTIYIGRESGDSMYFDGYMAEVVLLDGTAATPTSFGEFDEDSPQIFKPIDVSGLTFGTHGFYLDFEDSSNLGNDANGGTDFTENNLAATDQATDTPTNNFATWNSIAQWDVGGTQVYSEGNLKVAVSSNFGRTTSTIGVTAGKWYMEVKQTAENIPHGNGESVINVIGDPDYTTSHWNGFAQSFGIRNHNGYAYTGTSEASSWHPNWTVGDIIGVGLDMDNHRVYFSKNGQWFDGSGNADESTPTGYLTLSSSYSTYFLNVINSHDSATETYEVNFGSPSFTISSGNADANGYGNFEYSVPSGYYALCTKNLAEYG